MTSGKSGTSFQEKLTKQNDMNRQMLARELSKLEDTEKSHLRMLDTARQRFRCRYKKLGLRASSSGSEAYDVRMYETHNPGFCYHCTGAIKESGAGTLANSRQDTRDSYEVVRGMLFTNGEVDIDKILCLHVLTAHTTKNIDVQVSVSEADLKAFDRGLKKPLTGAWNNVLPCYVVEIQHDSDSADFDDPKFHQGPRKVSLENAIVRNIEKSYERYTQNNADIVSALTANDRLARIAPRTLGKMPIISPHVYSLLGASHELRVKQAIAEGYSGTRYYNKRSNVDLEMFDGKSIADSFRLLDDIDDDRSPSKITAELSARDWSTRGDYSKISAVKSNTRGSSIGSANYKIDRSITMLKGKSKKPVEELIKSWRINEKETVNDLVTIKPSYRIIAAAMSKTSSTKSPFRIIQNGTASSVNSVDSIYGSPRYFTKKYRKSVYLNAPVKSFVLKNEAYKTVKILVNNQIQALVHSVLDVLEKVNPEKLQKIVETARDYEKIREIFNRQDIQDFVESLMGQPLVSSPKSYVVSAATAVDEIDTRLKSFIEDELVATTLELPTAPILELLMKEIRDNIFSNGIKKSDATIMNLPDEKSMENGLFPINSNEESKSTKFVIENQKQISSGNDGTIVDHKVLIKLKTDDLVVRNKQEKKSNEELQGLEKITKLKDKDSAKMPGKNRSKMMKDSAKETASLNIVKNSSSTEKTQFKQKVTPDLRYLDPDRVILRRMTNEQRILVGRMCAALKNRRINNEGLIRERTPLAALITPVLSRESIKMLTRGTTYANKTGDTKKLVDEKEEQTVARTDRLTGPVLAKVRRDIAEHETKRRLDDFFTE